MDLTTGEAFQSASNRRRPRCTRLLLLFVTALSLVFVTAIDLPLFRMAARFAPRLTWIPDARLTSLLASAALYLAIRKARPSRLANSSAMRVAPLLLTSGAWLTATAIADFVLHVYLPPVRTVSAVVAFLVCGALAEEFLFRGAVFGLAEQVWGEGWRPVFFSAAAFSLAHLQYHSFHLVPEAWAQVGYTLPMGIVFGILRWRSQRLWPGTALHMANNCLALAAAAV